MAIDRRTAGAVTVSVVIPTIASLVAEITAEPFATPAARPAGETVAVVMLSEAQVAVADRSFVVPSSYVPVAENCFVSPTPIEGVAGVTAIDRSVAGVPSAVTVSVAVPVTPPLAAEMTVVPAATAVASPPAEIVAVAVIADLQVALDEMSLVVLSLKVPIATNGCVAPTAMDSLAGVTAIETSVFGLVALLPPLHPATETIRESATNARASIPVSVFSV